jgi:hypothetical protein
MRFLISQLDTYIGVVRCHTKNGYKQDTYLKEIGLCAQNMITIVGSIVDIIGGNLYGHLICTRFFAFTMNRILT